jgi:hypothetical protein
MTRLTLEALERRDLLSANPLAQSIAPPAPPAHFTIEMEDIIVSNVGTSQPPTHLTINLQNTMVSGFSGSQPHVYLSLELENTLVSSFSASHRPGAVADSVSISFAEVKFE